MFWCINVFFIFAVSKYCEKLRCELGRDTQFITSYSKSEETPLEELYMDTQMELLNDRGESLGYLQSLDELLGDQGVFNEQAETIFITGDAGVGKSIILQKLQNLWSQRELKTRAKFFFKFRCRMFSAFKETDEISLKDLIFKHNCYPDGDLDNEVEKQCSMLEFDLKQSVQKMEQLMKQKERLEDEVSGGSTPSSWA